MLFENDTPAVLTLILFIQTIKVQCFFDMVELIVIKLKFVDCKLHSHARLEVKKKSKKFFIVLFWQFIKLESLLITFDNTKQVWQGCVVPATCQSQSLPNS